jgi:hypothetical protein
VSKEALAGLLPKRKKTGDRRALVTRGRNLAEGAVLVEEGSFLHASGVEAYDNACGGTTWLLLINRGTPAISAAAHRLSPLDRFEDEVQDDLVCFLDLLGLG